VKRGSTGVLTPLQKGVGSVNLRVISVRGANVG